MRNAPFSRQVGYTLTELIIVVTILTIVAAIAVPAARSTGSDKELQLVAGEFAAGTAIAATIVRIVTTIISSVRV